MNCDRCGDEYNSYTVFIRDTPQASQGYKKLKEKGFDDLCKPCRKHLVDKYNLTGQAFTTENEEIEPKEDPNS